MTELAHTYENRLKLLGEVCTRLAALNEFLKNHPGLWTPEQFAEYKRCYDEWMRAANDLSYFEHPGTRPKHSN